VTEDIGNAGADDQVSNEPFTAMIPAHYEHSRNQVDSSEVSVSRTPITKIKESGPASKSKKKLRRKKTSALEIVKVLQAKSQGTSAHSSSCRLNAMSLKQREATKQNVTKNCL